MSIYLYINLQAVADRKEIQHKIRFTYLYMLSLEDIYVITCIFTYVYLITILGQKIWQAVAARREIQYIYTCAYMYIFLYTYILFTCLYIKCIYLYLYVSFQYRSENKTGGG
jgi:hypothetical protein